MCSIMCGAYEAQRPERRNILTLYENHPAPAPEYFHVTPWVGGDVYDVTEYRDGIVCSPAQLGDSAACPQRHRTASIPRARTPHPELNPAPSAFPDSIRNLQTRFATSPPHKIPSPRPSSLPLAACISVCWPRSLDKRLLQSRS